MKEYESVLKFIDLKVDYFYFNLNKDYYENEKETVNLSFESNTNIDAENNTAAIQLSCKIFDEDYVEQNQPFFLEIKTTGLFECRGDISQFETNSFAIIFPYIRAQISSFTSQAGIKPIILPPINVAHIIESKKHTG